MSLCDLNEIKVRVERQYEYCHGYSGNKKTIYREALLAVRSILHSAKTIDAVPVVRCRDCKHRYEDAWCEYVDDDDNFYCARGERKGGDG